MKMTTKQVLDLVEEWLWAQHLVLPYCKPQLPPSDEWVCQCCGYLGDDCCCDENRAYLKWKKFRDGVEYGGRMIYPYRPVHSIAVGDTVRISTMLLKDIHSMKGHVSRNVELVEIRQLEDGSHELIVRSREPFVGEGDAKND